MERHYRPGRESLAGLTIGRSRAPKFRERAGWVRLLSAEACEISGFQGSPSSVSRPDRPAPRAPRLAPSHEPAQRGCPMSPAAAGAGDDPEVRSEGRAGTVAAAEALS
jgi:hypothetical protein